MKLVLENLMPGEVVAISGVSLDNQRNMRRAGYLPKTKGHARFSIEDAARMLVIGLMSERGIGPKVSTAFAGTAARGIALHLLKNKSIYGHELAAPAFEKTKEEAEKDLDRVREANLDIEDAEAERFVREAVAFEFLNNLAVAELGARGERAPQHFFLWANGHPEFFYGEEHPFADEQYSLAAWQGPVIFFSLPALAALFASRLDRHIVRLEANPKSKPPRGKTPD